MGVLNIESLLDTRRNVTLSPNTTFGLAVLSIVFAFLYSLLQDFAKAFVKPPSHFKKRSWFEFRSAPKTKVPVVELDKSGDYMELLERGAKQFPDKPYKIKHHPGEIVIIPFSMIDEIKNQPEAKLSFQQGSYDFFMGWHTGVTNHERAVANILRVGVHRIIDAVYPVIQDEALKTVVTQLGEDAEWREIALFPKCTNMIMAISQRVFVGEPLCRNPEWLKSITLVTQNAFGSVPSLWKYNWLTRPFAAWRSPALLQVREQKEKAAELLKPVLEKRLQDLQDPGFKVQLDLMQVIIDSSKKSGFGQDLDYQLNAIIGTGRAALFTASMTLYHFLYDLAMHPEHIEPLRQEIRELGDVPMTRANVGKLILMDSCLRESQRFNMFMLVSTLRKVMQNPLVLSDGTTLPVGTILGVDVRNAVFANSTLEDPYTFDGFRFSRERAKAGNEQMYQSVQTANDHLVYGHGSQACPGRFFAAHEVKVTCARILMNYDIRIKNNKPGRKIVTDNVDGIMVKVDPTQMFEFRKIDGK